MEANGGASGSDSDSEGSPPPAWGHELMATTLAMQSAPPEVLSQIDKASRARRDQFVHHHQGQHQHQGKSVPITSQPTGEGAAEAFTGAAGHQHERQQQSESPSPIISWSSANVSLQKLFELAQVLNPPDSELAPVQAWFELARRHGLAAALDPDLLARAAYGLGAAVDCPVFGAVITRRAFDDVIGTAVSEWQSAGGGAGWWSSDKAGADFHEWGTWTDSEQVFWAKARAASWVAKEPEVAHDINNADRRDNEARSATAGSDAGRKSNSSGDDVSTRVKRRFLRFFGRRRSSAPRSG